MIFSISTIIWTVLSIVCIIYGFLIKSIGSGTRFFLVWIAIGIMFLLFATVSYLHIWSKLPSAVHYLVYTIVSLGLLCTIIICACIFSKFNTQANAPLDYIIVLGAQVRPTGPSAVLKYRLDTAIDYLNENPDTICIVSGGQGYNEPWTEAKGMADYLYENGISKDRIILEDRSTTTEQNFANSKKFLPDNVSTGIITNNFHMFRALHIAKKQGLTNVSGISAPSRLLYLPNNLLREILATLKMFL